MYVRLLRTPLKVCGQSGLSTMRQGNAGRCHRSIPEVAFCLAASRSLARFASRPCHYVRTSADSASLPTVRCLPLSQPQHSGSGLREKWLYKWRSATAQVLQWRCVPLPTPLSPLSLSLSSPSLSLIGWRLSAPEHDPSHSPQATVHPEDPASVSRQGVRSAISSIRKGSGQDPAGPNPGSSTIHAIHSRAP